MDSIRWKKIEDIFQDALDLSGDERENFIAEKTGDDAELRAEVEKLVARFEKEDEFLESPVWTDSRILGNTLKNRVASSLENEIFPEVSEKSFTGKRVGVYRLTDQIGKGGMGVVYAAERADGEFYQKVAVKLIKRGMDTDFIISRFRHERQILANLNHPNIARLLDGGTTSDDLPFFVMEFIEGEPLLKYSEGKNLDLRQKLKLFLQVCAPIVYAHKRKIIHRDIKPSNILVNEDGEPKLLDFGIAKLLDTDSIHESLLPTATAMRLMTPEYASPEQVRGEEITEASDQYSLGVLFYELITGARPYKFPSRSPQEIARVICEEIPSEPASGSFGKPAAGEIDVRFDEEYCKKLDRIVLKTLRKNPGERYASVEEFAVDIERFLRNDEIRAESFTKEQNQLGLSARDKVEITGESAPGTSENRSGEENFRRKKKAVSPRRKGVKQGIFITLLSIVSIPVLVLITVTAILPPQVLITIFILFFLGGFVRMTYALLFESGAKESEFSIRNETEFAEADTKFISSPAPRETAAAVNRSTLEKTGESEKIIAVLPFRHLNTLSGENTGGSDFLSVGLADSLITRISNVEHFVVRPTSSILKFGAGETDSIAAGKELNAGFVVEGNIIKTEKRIRVSVQLLDVEKRSTVWAERFEEDFTDILEIEDLISAKVVESLAAKNKSALKSFENEQNPSTKTNIESQNVSSKPLFPPALKYALLIAAPLGFGFLIYVLVAHPSFNSSVPDISPAKSNASPGDRWKNNFTSMMNIRRLNATGTVRRSVVSPDGKRIAYVSGDNQNQSLRIRETVSEGERELVAPETIFYLEVKFSPDGKYIYYLIDRAASPRTLYRISTGGGTSEKVSEEIFNSFALSSDGQKIAYDFENREKKNDNIRIADLIDGKNLQNSQFVAELFSPDYYMGSISFSPGSEKLMYAISKIEESKEVINLFVYDFKAKTETQLTTQNFSDITGGAWRNNGEEIVVCAAADSSSPYQLWLVSFPSGEVTRLTNDFYDYYGASLTTDSSVFVTIKKDSTSDLWTSELSGSSRDFDSKTKQVTNKSARQDGIEGVNWTKDGRILYISSANGENKIATIKTDGSDNRTIPVETSKPAHPSLTADSRHLVFADEKDQKMSIRHFDLQTGDAAEVSSRYAVTPTVSPDDRFVFYATFSKSSRAMSVHRKSLSGDDETEIASQTSLAPAISPDGKSVACLLSSKETGGDFQIAIFPAEKTDGNPQKILKVFQFGNSANPQSRPLAWSPDGKFLYFVSSADDVSNIFRVAVDGGQKSVQMTFFTSDKIFDFALAPDGKTVVLSRGSTSSDIVLFKQSR